MFDRHSIPTSDFINSFNTEWHDYHWLAQLLFYKVYQLGGYPGLKVLMGINFALLSFVLCDIAYLVLRRLASEALIFPFLLSSLIMIQDVASIRPQSLALLPLALVLKRLLQRRAWYELPLILFLTILLVNVHVYWVLVPLLWFLYRGVPRFLGDKTTSATYAWGGFLMLGLGGFVSPYGSKNYGLVLDYLLMDQVLKKVVNEFHSSITTAGELPWLLLGVWILIICTFRYRRALARPGQFLSALISGLMALWAVKFVAIFAVLGLPYLLRSTALYLKGFLPRFYRKPVWFIRGSIYLVLLCGIFGAVKTFPYFDDEEELRANTYPINACRELAQLDLAPIDGRSHLRVVTHFNDGGWCRWAAYETDPTKDIRVTNDGRTQGVPVSEILLGLELYDLKPSWAQTLKNLSPDAVVVSKNSALSQVLSLAKNDWKLVGQDETFGLFVPHKAP